jgi:lipoic acid synthetase/lipoyl(octanoyl) transferase
LFLVEHPPTLTLGRRGSRADVLWPPERLTLHGVEVCETPRGGQVTLHAPGQLVAYPVVYVGRQIRNHLAKMAAVTIELLEQLGVHGAEFRLEQPGVWIGPRKLASMGVHVRRGVAVQGIAVNLEVDPELFEALISCGMPASVMTNAKDVGGASISIERAAGCWAQGWAQACGVSLHWGEHRLP